MNIKYKLLMIAGAIGVTGAAIGGALYLAYPVQVSTLAGLTCNYLISWSAPPGTITTESNAAYKAGPASSTAARVSNLVNLSGKMPNAQAALSLPSN